jgi:HlyD family type I secretion membrane fusion protein
MLTALRRIILPPIEIEHCDDARSIVRAGLIVIAILVFVIGGFLAFAPLSGAVVAPAVVKVDLDRKVVQHQEGGIVSQILVRDGDRVQAGQTLLTIEDIRVDATNELLRTQLDAELARSARLGAEGRVDASVRFPRELTERAGDARVREQLERERSLFSARRDSLDGQVQLLRTQIRETQGEIEAWTGQLKAGDEAIRLQKEELAQNEGMAGQGFVSKSRILTLQRAVAEYEARRGENLAELAKAKQRVAELELRIVTVRNNYMEQAADELKESTARVFDLQERLRPSQDAAQRQVVKAPVAGEVVNLRVTTVGAVVGPRDPLLELVPENPDLIVEARLHPEDIASVSKGAAADVRLTAFKQRITPVVYGEVVYISADRMQTKPEEAPYYIAHVRVGAQALKEAGDLRLQAGMPAEVFIRTESRTALQYLLTPVSAYLQRSMREP